MTIKDTTGHTVVTQYVWGPAHKIDSYTDTEIIDGKEVAKMITDDTVTWETNAQSFVFFAKKNLISEINYLTW